MQERLPPPDLLIGFEAAARHLSFTKAAAERFVTQSAISRQIAQLEEHLGVPLFERRHRALALTPAGAQLAETVAQVLTQLRGTVERIRARPRREVLSLTTTPGLASLWLIPRLADFLAAHPGLDVRIDATLERREMERDGIDLAIRYAAVNGATGESLFDETLQPVCAPALRRDRARPLKTPADLRRHTLLEIATPPGARGMPNEWQSWLAAAGASDVEPAAMLSFNAYDDAVAAAVAGQGVLLGRRPLVDALLARGELLTPFSGSLVSARGYFIVVNPGSAQRPGVGALRDWLRRQT
jgi:LysR family transcriptional regulator, glycine cleavage system transcriptional activator